MKPEDAERTVERVRAALLDPKCVGDLGALVARVGQLEVLINVRRETLAEERAAAQQTTAERRAAIVAEAESLADSTSWRSTTERFKALVEEWKSPPIRSRHRAGAMAEVQRCTVAFDKARRTHFAGG